MKQPRIRYFLEANPDKFGKRSRKELVMAEVNAGFIIIMNGARKYSRFKISLEERIEPENFGYQKDNFKFNMNVLEGYSYRTKNKSLMIKMSKLHNKVMEVYNHFLFSDIIPNADEFKNELFIRMGRNERYKETKTLPTIKEALTKVVELEAKILSSSNDKKEENTLRTYNTLLHYIDRFEKVTGRTLLFDNFDNATYFYFWKVQNNIVKGTIKCHIEGHKKVTTTPYGMLSSSVNKYQKLLKTLLQKTGYETQLDYSDLGMIAKNTNNRKDIYLTVDELQIIIKANATENKFKIARDYILLSSMMGMRFESMKEAIGKTVNELESDSGKFYYIHSNQKKTKTETYIPIFKPALEIIKNNNNVFPKFPANSKVNQYVKEFLFEIGIHRKEKVKIIPYLDSPFEVEQPIYELISTHDFRKTFYTNLALINVPETTIDLVTHPAKSSNKMAKIYNKATLVDNARKFFEEVTFRNNRKKSKVYYFE